MRIICALSVLLALASCAISPDTTPRAAANPVLSAKIAAIETRSGGRLGVAVTDADGTLRFGHRADERFAMCSTFKLLLAGRVLSAATSGVPLRSPLDFTRTDLLPHSPGAEKLLDADGKGQYRIGFAARDAVVLSDNLAANLLLDRFGGPAGLTAFVRGMGDEVTRLDRMEPNLNENAPGDPRDTTSPAAIARSGAQLVFGDRLHQSHRATLRDWLVESRTGLARIRGGLPQDWVAGDKTGTCGTAYNDVAFVEQPGGGRHMIAIYLDRPAVSGDAANAAIAGAARAIAEDLLN